MSTYDRLIEKGVKQGIERGIEQGIKRGIEQGIERGIEQGIEQGIERGIEQGIEKKTLDVIKNCLKNGLNISMISNITGLSESKVEEIVKRTGV